MSEHTITSTRNLDEIPWSDGTGFTGSDWRKLDRALSHFWGNTQLAYKNGKKVRTNIDRKKPSKTLFDLVWTPKKKK